jgi:hypothetical protein
MPCRFSLYSSAQRCQIAIRQVAHVLSEKAEQVRHGRRPLWEVATGEEEHLSDGLRRHYQSQRDAVHFVEGLEEVQ